MYNIVLDYILIIPKYYLNSRNKNTFKDNLEFFFYFPDHNQFWIVINKQIGQLMVKGSLNQMLPRFQEPILGYVKLR